VIPWATFPRSLGQPLAEFRPSLHYFFEGEAGLDGVSDLVEHELKLAPVALVLAAAPLHIPRGKVIQPDAQGVQ
jgi:hypothetical protein